MERFGSGGAEGDGAGSLLDVRHHVRPFNGFHEYLEEHVYTRGWSLGGRAIRKGSWPLGKRECVELFLLVGIPCAVAKKMSAGHGYAAVFAWIRNAGSLFAIIFKMTWWMAAFVLNRHVQTLSHRER